MGKYVYFLVVPKCLEPALMPRNGVLLFITSIAHGDRPTWNSVMVAVSGKVTRLPNSMQTTKSMLSCMRSKNRSMPTNLGYCITSNSLSGNSKPIRLVVATLIKPTKRKRILKDATEANGINMSMLKNSPTFIEILDNFNKIMNFL